MPKDQALQTIDQPVDLVETNTVDIDKALKMRFRGATYQQIADVLGVTKQAVHQRLASFSKMIEDPGLVKAFRESEAEILDAAQREVIKNLIDKASDKKASVNNLAYTARQVFDMRRLIRGESTSNISQLTAIIQAASGSNNKDKKE